MNSQHPFRKSRFSHRLTVMFIGCALVPIITLAVIAYTSVSRQLLAQSHSNIGRAAKAHAIGIYDRLLSLQNQLQLIRLTLVDQKGHDLIATLGPMGDTLKEQFVTINYRYGGGIVSLLDQIPTTASGPPLGLPHGAPPKVSISIRKQVGLAPPKILMHLPLGEAGRTTAHLEAEVHPAFLWGLGHANTLPAQTELVVIGDNQETLINTSDLDILTLKEKLHGVTHNRNKGFRYSEREVDYHVSAWPLFLTPQFGIGTWRVSYIKAETVVLAPIHAFKRSFLLILLLTFWVVLLLSIRHIRQAVRPLKRLHAGTQELVQGNYTHHITVDGQDEFAQVSAAFNQMTDRIGRQVGGLRTIAEIGRETAAVLEVKALLKIEMNLMSRHLDFDKGLVLLEVPDNQYLYCAGHYGFGDSQKEALNHLRIDLAPHDLNSHPDLGPWFKAYRTTSHIAYDKPLPLGQVQDLLGAHAVIWTPIVYENAALGLLGVSQSNIRDAGELDQDLLRGISAQTAVALQNVSAFKQLQQSEARFRDIFASAASGMALLSPSGGLSEVNQRMMDITGYDTAALRQRTLANLLVEEEQLRMDTALQTLKSSQTALVMEEVRFQHACGEIHWGLLSISAYYGEAAETGHFIIQLTDINAQKTAEAEKRSLAKQLQQAQKMEAIGTLAGGIAHDFNNILGGIMGFAQLGGMTCEAGGKSHEKFAKIMDASERAKDLVQQILTFSRQSQQSHQAVRIDLILKEALKLLRASIPAHIEMKRHVPVIETCIMADVTQVHQIIMNLCTNAYHAMEEKGGVLNVKLSRHTPEAGEPDTPIDLVGVPCLEMIISDTGSGMDEDTLGRIFDPYFTTKPQGKGTGLGLSVVHGIVQSFGGHIQVTSTPNEGTSFQLQFPEVSAQPVQKVEAVAPEKGNGERVLLVDDEAMIIEVGSEMLTALGYEVTTSQDPQEALDNLRREPQSVDLVITDLAMPYLKGDDLARALHNIREDLPVVLCSGFSDPETSCPDVDTLFTAQLPKPFNSEDLQKAIQAAMAA